MYIKKRLFTFNNCVYMRNYIFIANLANILPKYCIFCRELLITYYKKTIQKAISQITAKKYLNFIINKTFNT